VEKEFLKCKEEGATRLDLSKKQISILPGSIRDVSYYFLILQRLSINPLNPGMPGHFYEFRTSGSGYHKVKPFYSGRIASKLMTKHTSLLTKNTAFEHKFHVDTAAKFHSP
jgi:hypothetical protein